MNIPERTFKSKQGLLSMAQVVAAELKAKGLPLTIVEVGGWTGAGTEVFVQVFDKVIVVDPWDAGQGEIAAEEDVAQAYKVFLSRHGHNAKVQILRMTSLEAARYDITPSCVYIDGLHVYEAVKKDLSAWIRKLPEGGILCGHDYTLKFPGVMTAVNEAGGPRLVFTDTSWVL